MKDNLRSSVKGVPLNHNVTSIFWTRGGFVFYRTAFGDSEC